MSQIRHSLYCFYCSHKGSDSKAFFVFTKLVIFTVTWPQNVEAKIHFK